MILQILLSYAIFAIFTACASVLMHWCIGSPRIYRKNYITEVDVKQGRIFSSYGNWLRLKILHHISNNIQPKINWYKPLGSCFICFSVWLNTILTALFTTQIVERSTAIACIIIAWCSISFAVMLSIYVINKLT